MSENINNSVRKHDSVRKVVDPNFQALRYFKQSMPGAQIRNKILLEYGTVTAVQYHAINFTSALFESICTVVSQQRQEHYLIHAIQFTLSSSRYPARAIGSHHPAHTSAKVQ